MRFTEKTDKIFHIPKLLYYWRKHPESTNSSYQAKSYAYEAGKKALEEALHRRGENGVVIPDKDIKGFYSIRYEINNYNLVSIIIPTRDLGDVLDGCLESIFSKTIYPNYEVILVDNGSKERETFAVIDKWKQLEPDKFKCHQYDVPFNYSHINNYAVTKAQGKYLLFLNNDTEVITSNWIDAMVEQAQRQSIGAVGAYLKYPDDTPQHTGVILGYGILAGNSHTSYNKILNFSAVTGACLMCRREVFAEIGGFDEQLEIAFNDVDLCLKMYQKGYQDVCLPHVLLYHYESKSIGYQRETTEKINRYQQEIKYMQNKWGNLIENDPCNSPVVINNYQENIKLSYQFTIVVPWWDHTNLLQLWEDNITFLQQAEVIFVDNGSAEEGKKALEEFCHKYSVKLIRNATNLGFSAANNQGLKAANREFILHLNNDISIKYLPFVYLAYLAENGIAGPGEVQNELYTPYVEGWGLCIKKSILEELGGWNEIYGPGYWDDVDLCYRAKLAGYPVIAIPQMSQWIEHITNATGRDGRLEQIALHITNRKKFIEQYLNISPKIIIDGVFFQLYKTGIARVWKSLLEEWANTDFANHILVLDRANTAPKINGIRYRAASPYNYNDTESDRQMLQQICDEEGAELFISTYYTTPINTPSVFMAYDMIPEVLGGNLNEPMWREKHNAIKHASAFISISENTASDLSRFFPDIS
ncbi:MAG: glycosyltransferase, partial [Sphaerospermopsis kisseleviana]